MQPCEAAATAVQDHALDELMLELGALANALCGWDRSRITTAEATARRAFDKVRSNGGPPATRLIELMTAVDHCQQLAKAGAVLTGAMARVGAGTYEPPTGPAGELVGAGAATAGGANVAG